MKIAIIGSQQFGKLVFDALKEKEGIDLVAVAAPKGDVLATAAGDANVAALFETSTLKDDDVLKHWTSLGTELIVMAFVTNILPPAALECRLGAIQYHPSLLPLNRGISSINWAVIKQQPRTGYSIFWVDKYIDHGPILLQEEVEIKADDTVKSLYFNQLMPMGVSGMCKAVDLVLAGEAPRIEQEHWRATYEPPCKGAVAQIQWHADGLAVYALIHGCDPQPGAYTVLGDKKLKIFDCALIKGEKHVGWPGKVVRIDDSGVLVRLNGDCLALLIKRVQLNDDKKTVVDEKYAKETLGLKVGFRFK